MIKNSKIGLIVMRLICFAVVGPVVYGDTSNLTTSEINKSNYDSNNSNISKNDLFSSEILLVCGMIGGSYLIISIFGTCLAKCCLNTRKSDKQKKYNQENGFVTSKFNGSIDNNNNKNKDNKDNKKESIARYASGADIVRMRNEKRENKRKLKNRFGNNRLNVYQIGSDPSSPTASNDLSTTRQRSNTNQELNFAFDFNVANSKPIKFNDDHSNSTNPGYTISYIKNDCNMSDEKSQKSEKNKQSKTHMQYHSGQSINSTIAGSIADTSHNDIDNGNAINIVNAGDDDIVAAIMRANNQANALNWDSDCDQIVDINNDIHTTESPDTNKHMKKAISNSHKL